MFSTFGRNARLGTRAAAIALAAVVLAACGGSSNDVPVPPLFSTTVVLGSSLSDTGNLCPTSATPGCPPVPPYAAGRYSNGTLYVERIAARYGAPVAPSTRGGTNFAYAGARTGSIPGLTTQSTIPSVVAQLDAFAARQAATGRAIDERTLVVVEAGGAFFNNFAAGLPLIQAGTITSTQFVTAAVTDVVTVMTRLYSMGARNILLVNSPNLGGTPGVRALGAAAQGAGTQLAAGFNQALAGQVTVLTANSPGLRVYTLDAFALFNELITSPGSFQLTNVTDPCVTTPTCVGSAATANTYMFWDDVHPTVRTGEIVAQRALTLLPSP